MPVIYVLFTGGFDPVHSGHINCMKQAATLGNLVVAPNSDRWLAKKKGAAFQPLNERVAILENFKFVHSVLTNWDDQDGSAKNAIYDFYNKYGDSADTLLFANGGDRTPNNVGVGEIETCFSLGILPIFNVGGGKTQSSSSFLQEWTRRI